MKNKIQELESRAHTAASQRREMVESRFKKMQQKSSTNLVPDTVLGKSQGSVIGKSQGLFSMGNSSTNFNSNTQKPILTPSQNMRPYT